MAAPEEAEDGTLRQAVIVDFRQYRNRELIDVLETALAEARAGRIDGAVMAFHGPQFTHSIAVAGFYERAPRAVYGIGCELIIKYMPKDPDRPTVID